MLLNDYHLQPLVYRAADEETGSPVLPLPPPPDDDDDDDDGGDDDDDDGDDKDDDGDTELTLITSANSTEANRFDSQPTTVLLDKRDRQVDLKELHRHAISLRFSEHAPLSQKIARYAVWRFLPYESRISPPWALEQEEMIALIELLRQSSASAFIRDEYMARIERLLGLRLQPSGELIVRILEILAADLVTLDESPTA